MKIKFIPSVKVSKKGTQAAKDAAKKAAETRARNRALRGDPKTQKPLKLKLKKEKVAFTKLGDSNYHAIAITAPCTIYLHKTMNALYISPNITVVNGNDDKKIPGTQG